MSLEDNDTYYMYYGVHVGPRGMVGNSCRKQLASAISWVRRNRVVTPLFVKNHFFTWMSLFSTYTCPGKMISSYHLK